MSVPTRKSLRRDKTTKVTTPARTTEPPSTGRMMGSFLLLPLDVPVLMEGPPWVGDGDGVVVGREPDRADLHKGAHRETSNALQGQAPLRKW